MRINKGGESTWRPNSAVAPLDGGGGRGAGGGGGGAGGGGAGGGRAGTGVHGPGGAAGGYRRWGRRGPGRSHGGLLDGQREHLREPHENAIDPPPGNGLCVWGGGQMG